MWINGEECVGGGKKFDVVNPAKAKVISAMAAADEKDVDAAVAAARQAFDSWAEQTGEQRSRFLVAIANQVLERRQELAELETLDSGKPLDESLWDMDDVAGCFKYYAELAKDLDGKQGEKVDVGDDMYECSLHYAAAGVAALVTPFNYPLLMSAWKLAPALAAGCTAVLKPSELAPLTTLELGAICAKVGVPPGVVNVLAGDGATGDRLVNHPGVDVVGFTGSVPTGLKVAHAAAARLKGLGLELGGKSAALVFPDVRDMNNTAEWVAFGAWWTIGQICTATSRLLVQESVADELIGKLQTIAAGVQMGDPMKEGCRLGPVVSQRQQQKVLGLIAQAVEQGAELVQGSAQAPAGLDGFFVTPTILKLRAGDTTNVAWTEEIFGPVLTVQTFKTEEEALRLANDSKFGLAAAVFTEDKARFARLNNKLRVGIVWNRCAQPAFPQLPWGGTKQSGNVTRDLGEFALKKYLEPKQIVKYVSEDPLDWFDTSKL